MILSWFSLYLLSYIEIEIVDNSPKKQIASVHVSVRDMLQLIYKTITELKQKVINQDNHFLAMSKRIKNLERNKTPSTTDSSEVEKPRYNAAAIIRKQLAKNRKDPEVI